MRFRSTIELFVSVVVGILPRNGLLFYDQVHDQEMARKSQGKSQLSSRY